MRMVVSGWLENNYTTKPILVYYDHTLIRSNVCGLHYKQIMHSSIGLSQVTLAIYLYY